MARPHNSEGFIFLYRNRFTAYAPIVTPDGRRQRKYVNRQCRTTAHDKWLALVAAAGRGPIAVRPSAVSMGTGEVSSTPTSDQVPVEM